MEKDLRYYAKVHSIESFGTVDGPGIRFVLFLQGCHLQCKYCHNRDTWDMNAGEYKSVDEIVEKINRYKNYIIPSGGGVTVTGGEPLLQYNFVLELFKKLKEEGISTCIDTSGMVALTDGIKEVLKYTDLGYTDDEQDLLRLKDFLSTLKTVEKVQILPYHSMGKYKWENLGLKYPLEGVRDGTQEDVDRAKNILGI